MAKATKTKKRSTAMAPYNRGGPMQRSGKGKNGGSRKGGASSSKQLQNFALGGAIVGFLTKPGDATGKGGGPLADNAEMLAKYPSLATLGGAGVIAVIAHFAGKGKSGMLTNVRNAAAAIAVAHMVQTKV